MSPHSDSGIHIRHRERKNGNTKKSLGCHASTSRNTPRGIHIPASVVQADNSHRVAVVLTNVSSRRMEIPKQQKIANLQQCIFLDRDKTIGYLAHRDVLSDRSCREGTIKRGFRITVIYLPLGQWS